MTAIEKEKIAQIISSNLSGNEKHAALIEFIEAYAQHSQPQTLSEEVVLEILKDELWLNNPFGNETPHDKQPSIEGIEDATKAICQLPPKPTPLADELYKAINQHLELSQAEIKDLQGHNVENSNDMFIKKHLADLEFKVNDSLKLMRSLAEGSNAQTGNVKK